MELEGLVFAGGPIDDLSLLELLPEALVAALTKKNGFISHRGGFHLRGACVGPWWHSLRQAWEGTLAFHNLYSCVGPADIPFGEDCMGDQFLIRDATVVRLRAETGELESLDVALPTFLQDIQADALEILQLQPLLQFEQEGGTLSPGQLLAFYPPFFTEAASRSLRAIDARERRSFLAEVAGQIRDVPDGAAVKFVVEPLSKGRPTTG